MHEEMHITHAETAFEFLATGGRCEEGVTEGAVLKVCLGYVKKSALRAGFVGPLDTVGLPVLPNVALSQLHCI